MTDGANYPRKALERFLLQRFAIAAGIALEVVEEREAPDFIARIDDRLVGLELTELFVEHQNNSHTLQAQESIGNRIVAKAQKLYEKSNALPAHVTVCFTPSHDLRKLNRDHASEALADFVRGLALAPWQRADWRIDFTCDPPLEGISLLHAIGVPTHAMAHWSVARAGWVAPLLADSLQARVDEKAKRLPAYSTSISENWLVVIANAMNPSQLIDLRSDFQPSKIASPFARTYFYKHPDSIVIQLGETR